MENFAANVVGQKPEPPVDMVSDGADEGIEEEANPPPSSPSNAFDLLSATKLMTAVKAVAQCKAAGNLSELAATAASILESTDRVAGSVSAERKAKSLTSRWLQKASTGKDATSNKGDELSVE